MDIKSSAKANFKGCVFYMCSTFRAMMVKRCYGLLMYAVAWIYPCYKKLSAGRKQGRKCNIYTLSDSSDNVPTTSIVHEENLKNISNNYTLLIHLCKADMTQQTRASHLHIIIKNDPPPHN